MKYEEVYLKDYETLRDVVDQLPRFNDDVDNGATTTIAAKVESVPLENAE